MQAHRRMLVDDDLDREMNTCDTALSGSKTI